MRVVESAFKGKEHSWSDWARSRSAVTCFVNVCSFPLRRCIVCDEDASKSTPHLPTSPWAEQPKKRTLIYWAEPWGVWRDEDDFGWLVPDFFFFLPSSVFFLTSDISLLLIDGAERQRKKELVRASFILILFRGLPLKKYTKTSELLASTKINVVVPDKKKYYICNVHHIMSLRHRCNLFG